MTESDRWLLSFYRASELQGALFFGRLARTLREPGVVSDMTAHFADEARHAALFSRCLDELGAAPCTTGRAYQDGYLEAAGLPASLLEVLALTHVFERRVMRQYAEHLRLRRGPAEVEAVLRTIMRDERRHVAWTKAAVERLGASSPDRAAVAVDALRRYAEADRLVHDEASALWRAAVEAA